MAELTPEQKTELAGKMATLSVTHATTAFAAEKKAIGGLDAPADQKTQATNAIDEGSKAVDGFKADAAEVKDDAACTELTGKVQKQMQTTNRSLADILGQDDARQVTRAGNQAMRGGGRQRRGGGRDSTDELNRPAGGRRPGAVQEARRRPRRASPCRPMPPLFSVIIPTFDRATLIGATLASVVGRPGVEVIVVDDGSTDGTPDVVATFPTVTLLRQAHLGPGAARNAGLAVAAGEYAAFLDSDDLWLPWTADTYAQVIRRHHRPAFVAGKPLVFDGLAAPELFASPLATAAFADALAGGDQWRWFSASSFVMRDGRRPGGRRVHGRVGERRGRRPDAADGRGRRVRAGDRPAHVRLAAARRVGHGRRGPHGRRRAAAAGPGAGRPLPRRPGPVPRPAAGHHDARPAAVARPARDGPGGRLGPVPSHAAGGTC